jgi:hypothetical protein
VHVCMVGCACMYVYRLLCVGARAFVFVYVSKSLNCCKILGLYLDRKEKLQAEHILRIFKGISDEDIRILGLDPVYSRPEWLIIKNFPVGPPAVRPTVIVISIYHLFFSFFFFESLIIILLLLLLFLLLICF